MGHLDQERSSIRSTKKTLPETTDTMEKEKYIPEQETGIMQTHDMYIVVEEIIGKIYIQTGQAYSQLNIVRGTATSQYSKTITQKMLS